MREDSLSKLDRFQGRIPNLLNNLLRLDHLDRDATIRAIREPLAAYNKCLQPGEPPASIDDKLVDALLDQVKTGSISLDQARQAGAASVGAGPINDGTWIETAFLQIVLVRLWDEETKRGSRRLQLGTLKKLGGASKIMRSHLDKAMGKLRWRYRRIAADIFGYLVTPSGGKIAQTVADLASYCRRRQSRVASLLERLADSNVRVLRAISSPPGEPGGVRYEIFHDVLAQAILDWRSRKLVWRRVRRSLWWIVGTFAVFLASILLLFVIGLLAMGVTRFREQAQAGFRQAETGQKFREKAKTDLVDSTDPIRDVTALRHLLLALQFNRMDTEAEKLTRDLLLQHVWCPPAAPDVSYREDTLLAATFASGGNNDEIFAVAGNGQLLRWKSRELSPVRSLFEKPQPANLQEIVQPGFASFSPDGKWLLIIPSTRASVANAEAAASGGVEHGTPAIHGSSGERLPYKIQTWQWSAQNRTYEHVTADLEIQRIPDSPTNFIWSADSNCIVLINLRGGDNPECHFFQTEDNRIRELPDQSAKLTGMKIVALAFSADGNRIAGVLSDRRVTLIGRDDLVPIPKALNGKDWISLPEGFQPNSIAFGPGEDELTLTSRRGVGILNLRDGGVGSISPSIFQFTQTVVGPGDFGTRLVATSLNGRVQVAKGARMQEPAEPVVFRGSIGIPKFSLDGQRLLILSGGTMDALDTMRLVDVSPLYRTPETAPAQFKETPAPPWLVDIARTVSALDPYGDGSLVTLEDVRKWYPGSKAGDAYESVWKRFFPEESSGH